MLTARPPQRCTQVGARIAKTRAAHEFKRRRGRGRVAGGLGRGEQHQRIVRLALQRPVFERHLQRTLRLLFHLEQKSRLLAPVHGLAALRLGAECGLEPGAAERQARVAQLALRDRDAQQQRLETLMAVQQQPACPRRVPWRSSRSA